MIAPRDRRGYAGGLAAGIATNFIWGLAIVIPVLLPEQGALALTLGRYTAYGIVSLGVILVMRAGTLRTLARRDWLTALVFAAAGNVGYYFLFVLAIANAGAPIVAAIIGALPVTVALYGNWRRREFPFGRLVIPIVLLVAGMALMNVAEMRDGAAADAFTPRQRVVGIACAFAALGLWTWYAIANADFLKARPQLRAGAWSTAIGVATLALVLMVLPLVLVTDAGASTVEALRASGASTLWRLAVASVVLGVVVSWGGTLLWNIASERLPVALAGQLIVLETIAGMSYVFMARGSVPSAMTIAGVALLAGGVLLGIRRTRPKTIEAHMVTARGCEEPHHPDEGSAEEQERDRVLREELAGRP